jgi:hypothetical protein
MITRNCPLDGRITSARLAAGILPKLNHCRRMGCKIGVKRAWPWRFGAGEESAACACRVHAWRVET